MSHLAHLLCRGVTQNRIVNIRVDADHLVEPEPASEPRAETFAAAGRAPPSRRALEELWCALSRHFDLTFHFAGDLFWFGAMAAQTTCQPLRHDKPHGGCYEKRLDAHIDKARERAQRVVGVQSREYHVPGQCRLYCDLGRLQITYLSDHDFVGVLAQDRAQSSREGIADIRLSVDLADPLDRVFNRLLDGHDFSRAVVNFLEGGVEGGRFAGPGWSGNKDDAVWLADPVTEQLKVTRSHAEAIELKLPAFLRQQTQH